MRLWKQPEDEPVPVAAGPQFVAVIIPVFNRAHTVCETLNSLAAQTRAPDRIVLVDDGSQDGSGDVIRTWIAHVNPNFPVELIRQENRGVSAARNVGIRAAEEATHFGFLDSDDLWPDDFLARTTARFAQHPAAVAVSTDCLKTDENTGESVLLEHRCLEHISTTNHFFRYSHQGTGTLFRADVVRNCGCYREDLHTGEDLELYLRISTRGQWKFAPGKPAVYRKLKVNRTHKTTVHLSEAFSDTHFRWAQSQERSGNYPEVRRLLRGGTYRKAMQFFWQRAYEEAVRNNSEYHLEYCAAKMAEYSLWKLPSWFRKAA